MYWVGLANPTILQQLDGAGIYVKEDNQNGMGVESLGLIPNSAIDGPWADTRVRRALCYAIDVDAINAAFLMGMAQMTDQWAVPGSATYNDSQNHFTYDPEKAKSLLAEAGYADGFTTNIITISGMSDMLTAIANMLDEVGIHCNIQQVDSASVRSAIGQGTNNYTVSQINRYVTAVANRGTVYSLSLIDKTTDSNGKLIKDYTPEVVNQMDEISSSTWDLVHNGMESMVKSSSTFAGMDISMGGKTGTAQYSKMHADNVLFVGYAPADSPEISIAVRIANGYASTYAAEIGRDITKVYFNPESADELLQGYASSLGTAEAGD